MGFRYIKDGEPRQSDMLEVMVESESDLANLTDTCPGMIAFTAGYNHIWQMDADGTWVDMLEMEE